MHKQKPNYIKKRTQGRRTQSRRLDSVRKEYKQKCTDRLPQINNAIDAPRMRLDAKDFMDHVDEPIRVEKIVESPSEVVIVGAPTFNTKAFVANIIKLFA